MFLLKFKNCDNFYLSLKVAEGVPEVIGTHTGSSVNHQSNAEIVNLFEGTRSNSFYFFLKKRKKLLP